MSTTTDYLIRHIRLHLEVENDADTLAKLDSLEKIIERKEKIHADATEELNELKLKQAVQKEFFDLTTIEITDTNDEVVFWKDENYEYAKALLKDIKEKI